MSEPLACIWRRRVCTMLYYIHIIYMPLLHGSDMCIHFLKWIDLYIMIHFWNSINLYVHDVCTMAFQCINIMMYVHRLDLYMYIQVYTLLTLINMNKSCTTYRYIHVCYLFLVYIHICQATRTRTQMKMLRGVQNERFIFWNWLRML